MIKLISILFLFVHLTSSSKAQDRNKQDDFHEISVIYNEEIGKINKIWQFFGYDEANYTFTEDGEKLLSEIAKISDGASHIRTHHLLTSGNGETWLKWSSTNVYSEDEKGNPVYDWTIFDRIIDTYVELGLKPFVQLGFMPRELSSNPDPYTPEKITYGEPKGMVRGGAFYPPKDYDKWKILVAEIAKHCIERYGKIEAESWYWEPWNEPNGGYWKGTPEEYFKLYDYALAGVKSVLPDAKFGGPHITNPDYSKGGEFLVKFLDHITEGTNYVTGEKGSQIDFLVSHAKGGTEWEKERVVMNLGNHLLQINKAAEIISRYPELEGKEMIIGESDPDGCAGCSASFYPQNNYRNSSQFAAYTAAGFMRKQDVAGKYGIDLTGALTWAFTFPGQPWFDGFRALSTNGVVKPVFNTFRLCSKLSSKRIKVLNDQRLSLDSLMKSSVREMPDIDAAASKSDSSLEILIWNYHDIDTNYTADILINIKNLPENVDEAIYSRYLIDENYSNAFSAWKKSGSPKNPDPKQLKEIMDASELQYAELPKKIKIDEIRKISFEMNSQSVSLISLKW